MAKANLRSYLKPKINASEVFVNEYGEVLKYSKKIILSTVMKIKNVNAIANVHLLRGEIFDVM